MSAMALQVSNIDRNHPFRHKKRHEKLLSKSLDIQESNWNRSPSEAGEGMAVTESLHANALSPRRSGDTLMKLRRGSLKAMHRLSGNTTSTKRDLPGGEGIGSQDLRQLRRGFSNDARLSAEGPSRRDKEDDSGFQEELSHELERLHIRSRREFSYNFLAEREQTAGSGEVSLKPSPASKQRTKDDNESLDEGTRIRPSGYHHSSVSHRKSTRRSSDPTNSAEADDPPKASRGTTNREKGEMEYQSTSRRLSLQSDARVKRVEASKGSAGPTEGEDALQASKPVSRHDIGQTGSMNHSRREAGERRHSMGTSSSQLPVRFQLARGYSLRSRQASNETHESLQRYDRAKQAPDSDLDSLRDRTSTTPRTVSTDSSTSRRELWSFGSRSVSQRSLQSSETSSDRYGWGSASRSSSQRSIGVRRLSMDFGLTSKETNNSVEVRKMHATGQSSDSLSDRFAWVRTSQSGTTQKPSRRQSMDMGLTTKRSLESAAPSLSSFLEMDRKRFAFLRPTGGNASHASHGSGVTSSLQIQHLHDEACNIAPCAYDSDEENFRDQPATRRASWNDVTLQCPDSPPIGPTFSGITVKVETPPTPSLAHRMGRRSSMPMMPTFTSSAKTSTTTTATRSAVSRLEAPNSEKVNLFDASKSTVKFFGGHAVDSSINKDSVAPLKRASQPRRSIDNELAPIVNRPSPTKSRPDRRMRDLDDTLSIAESDLSAFDVSISKMEELMVDDETQNERLLS